MKINKTALKITLISLVTLMALVLVGFYIYASDYSRSDYNALKAFSTGTKLVQNDEAMMAFRAPTEDLKDTAVIFYPGGKVQYSAYAPLLTQLSNEGITCVLLKMPLNLAVFDINAADKVYSNMPEIKNWYLAGHSLGGAMASSYMGKNSAKVKGLILLGAYPVNASSVPTLAIYGSEDIALDKTKLETATNKLEIIGGNHAQFGNYGEQKGDGQASIFREEQQKIAVKEIVKFIKSPR
ncbi:MAG TPA: alpha/beta hydrolase [Desulfosporosinus sp.]|nr:alpha/beta hydrolase [Desulfosporosinus sp.]